MEPADLLNKTIADKYHILETRPSGNFSWVFLADQRIGATSVRPVAVKVTKEGGMTSEDCEEGFADVICLAKVLGESRDSEGKRFLVNVYDWGILDDLGGRGYIVMEYISGTTLEQHMGSLPKYGLHTGIRYAKEICKALRVPHSLKTPVIHRDIKPDNILVTPEDEIRVVDFGLAVRQGEPSKNGVDILGVIDYVAPEIIKHGSAACTPASDVYSVGLVLYKLFTGRHPFEQLSAAAPLQEEEEREYHYETRRTLSVTPPSELNGTIDANLEKIVLKCLAFKPRGRFQSAGELLEALEGEQQVDLRETQLEVAGGEIDRKEFDHAITLCKQVLESCRKGDDRLKLKVAWQIGKIYLFDDTEERSRVIQFFFKAADVLKLPLDIKKSDTQKAIEYLEIAKGLDGYLKRVDKIALYRDLEKVYRKEGANATADSYGRTAERFATGQFNRQK